MTWSKSPSKRWGTEQGLDLSYLMCAHPGVTDAPEPQPAGPWLEGGLDPKRSLEETLRRPGLCFQLSPLPF